MATPRSAMRYRPITGWLDPRKQPVAERRSREYADVQGTRRSRAALQADVPELEGQEEEEEGSRRAWPVSRPARAARGLRADACETRPGDDVCDDERWEEEKLPRTQAPRRETMPRVSAASRRSHAQAPRTRKRRWLPGVVALVLLIPGLIGLYSLVWHFHAQSAQDAVSSRFGAHAPVDTLVLGDQVVLARNSGGTITVFFIPADGGQGSKLVLPLSGSEWGTPSLVMPTLSMEKGVLALHLVGVPTYPAWAQPEATYRLQRTAAGYQAAQVA